MMPPTSIDGTDITGATIDGQDVEEITVDGQTVFSAGPPIIEDFENGDLSNYAGDTGPFQVQTGTVFNGTFALEYSNSSVVSAITRIDLQISQSDPNFEWRQYVNNAKERTGLVFAVQSETGNNNLSGYICSLEDAGSANRMWLGRYDNGSVTWVVQQGPSVPSNQWLRNTMEWETDNSFTWKLFNSSGSLINTVTATDSEYTGGGIGWQVFPRDSNSEVYFDSLQFL